MKKILVLALAVLMLAALFVSCGGNTGDGDVSTDPDGNVVTTDPSEIGFTAVNETLYVIAEQGLNVRKYPDASADSNKIGTLAYGKAVTRTGVNEATGWSRIMFNNEIAYVKSEYLSATEPAETTPAATETDVPETDFVACDETVYAYPTDNDKYISDGKINVYSAPNRSKWTDNITAGTAVKRIGKTTEDNEGNGWSKLEYNGKIVYARNSVVTLTDPTQTSTETSAQ